MNLDLKNILKSFSLSALTLLLSVTVLYAATTIGSNIDTDGTLLINNATSTITNLVTVNATSTNATTTTLYASGFVNLIGSLRVNNATSTITNLDMVNATSTNATTTKLYVSSTIIAAGNVAAGTTSVPVSGEIVASHVTATTTLNLFAAGTNKGGCIQLTGPANAAYRIYVGGAGNALIVQIGECK